MGLFSRLFGSDETKVDAVGTAGRAQIVSLDPDDDSKVSVDEPAMLGQGG